MINDLCGKTDINASTLPIRGSLRMAFLLMNVIIGVGIRLIMVKQLETNTMKRYVMNTQISIVAHGQNQTWSWGTINNVNCISVFKFKHLIILELEVYISQKRTSSNILFNKARDALVSLWDEDL